MPSAFSGLLSTRYFEQKEGQSLHAVNDCLKLKRSELGFDDMSTSIERVY